MNPATLPKKTTSSFCNDTDEKQQCQLNIGIQGHNLVISTYTIYTRYMILMASTVILVPQSDLQSPKTNEVSQKCK